MSQGRQLPNAGTVGSDPGPGTQPERAPSHAASHVIPPPAAAPHQLTYVAFTSSNGGTNNQAHTFVIPEELNRIPSGDSVLEVDSVLGDSGRTYHGYKEGKYFLPNDPAEQDRLDFQHAGITILLGDRLFWAPMKSIPERVIDVGTGTGIWAIDFAQQYPTSYVLGTDLSAIQPPPEKLPNNCEFMREDSEEDWVFTHKFDYVHLRFVFTCFNDARKVLQQAFESLRPGGWIEYQDVYPTLMSLDGNHRGSALEQWCNECIRGAAAAGRDIMVAEHYKDWMLEAGFVEVEEKLVPWPFGTWPDNPSLKTAGQYQQRNMMDGARGIAWKMLQASGMTTDEIESVIKDMKVELRDKKNRWFSPFYVVYGRKPFE